jgi:8-oxo-dGTP diphosphatase
MAQNPMRTSAGTVLYGTYLQGITLTNEPIDRKTLANLPSPFYRVTVKALIFDDQKRLLVTKNNKGYYEMPGGGWEYGEDYQHCLMREVQEELGVEVDSMTLAVCFWGRRHHTWGYQMLRIACVVRLKRHDFKPGDGTIEARFMTQDEFMRIDLTTYEGNVQQQADTIWSEAVLDQAHH